MPGLRVAMTIEQLFQPVPGGSGSYVIELLTALTGLSEVAVTGLAARHRHPAVTVPVPVVDSPLPRRALYEAWARLRAPRAEGAVRDAQVVHATTWAVPGTRRPLVVTVHDLAFLRRPGDFTPHGVRYFRRALDIVRAEAEVVIVPSRATREDCVSVGIEPSRLVVVTHGVRREPVTAGEVATFRKRHGLVRPYVLWCGTVEPRKNLERQVTAFLNAGARLGDVDLVLVGPTGWGAAEQRVAELLSEAPVGRVHRLGRLSGHELQVAYAGALAFTFASTWEGFGMPVLEAMAHGVPVLTSAGTSMAEVAGGAAVLVDPEDVDEISDGLVAVVDDADAVRGRAGLAVAGAATWERAARETATVYRSAAGLSDDRPLG